MNVDPWNVLTALILFFMAGVMLGYKYARWKFTRPWIPGEENPPILHPLGGLRDDD